MTKNSSMVPSIERRVSALTFVFLLMSIVGFSIVISPTAMSSNHQCQGDIQTTKWNESISKHALVPFYNTNWFYYEDVGFGGKDVAVSEPMMDEEVQVQADPALHPEEEWMYAYPYSSPLDTLTTNHFFQLVTGNDSAGAIRLNLSSSHRTTFCIQILSSNSTDATPSKADIYLMTSSEYQKYQSAYSIAHGNYWYDFDYRGLDDDPSPPEWQNFDISSWKSFRDVHEYENVDTATFSVSLDGPEAYTSIFGETVWDEFYLVIDAWDSSRTDDAQALGEPVYADVTVISNQRSFILPNWSVALIFFVFCASLIAVPVLLNQRYMKAGINQEQQSTFVPTVHNEMSKTYDDFPMKSEEE
ncbi:MAG: hypothetical protein O3A74_02805 [archaeon]|nr:hypothetical protein [archaeon]MDA0842924.1 hypothetical protein [archaeon]